MADERVSEPNDPGARDGRPQPVEREPNIPPSHGDPPHPAQPVPPSDDLLSCWVPRTRRLSEAEWQDIVSRIEILAILPPAARSKPERFTFRIGDHNEVCYGRMLPTIPR